MLLKRRRCCSALMMSLVDSGSMYTAVNVSRSCHGQRDKSVLCIAETECRDAEYLDILPLCHDELFDGMSAESLALGLFGLGLFICFFGRKTHLASMFQANDNNENN